MTAPADAGTKTLRHLLEDAEAAIQTYRHPDIDEAQARLNDVLEAAGLGSTGSDEITYLRVGDKEVSVGTRYSVRSCEQHDSFELPIPIIDASDPVAAGKLWGLQRKRDKAVNEVESAERSLAHRREELAKVEAALRLLISDQGVNQ